MLTVAEDIRVLPELLYLLDKEAGPDFAQALY
jgi:hypothetical protein